MQSPNSNADACTRQEKYVKAVTDSLVWGGQYLKCPPQTPPIEVMHTGIEEASISLSMCICDKVPQGDFS